MGKIYNPWTISTINKAPNLQFPSHPHAPFLRDSARVSFFAPSDRHVHLDRRTKRNDQVTKEEHVGVSKNRGTPKWIMEIPIKLDDLGVPPFSETPMQVK